MLITKNKGKGTLKKAILVTGLSLTLLIFALLPAITITSAGVVINEFEQNPHSGDSGKEWVELYNNGSETVDISGWKLIDGYYEKVVTIPSVTIIPGKGYYTINWTNGTLMNSAGENITLLNATGSEVDETLTATDEENDNNCWARNPNGYDTGSDSDWRFQISTRGVNNEHDATVSPNTTVPGTIRDYNFTITNNYKVFEKVKITLPPNFIFIGNRYSITSDIPLFDTANVTTTSNCIEITNVNFANDTDGWVKVDDIRVNATDSFNVTGYNSTGAGNWTTIDTPQVSMVASPAAQNLTVHVIPSATAGTPQTIYVQAQNASGYLSNTTNISVLLKVNSSDASLTGGITEKEIYLVNGENCSVKINSTKKGAYKITAYDLSITESPLQNGSDTIIYEAAEGYRLRFNQTSATGFAGENVSLRLFTEDIFGNENSSITDQVFLRVESPSGNAKLTYVNDDISPVYGGTYDLVNGSLTIKVIDSSIETATLIADDISGTPPHLISATATINFTSGNITEIQVLPSADSNRTVNTTLQITAQLLDSGGNNVSEENVSVNFSLAGNITSLPGFENGTLSTYSVLTDENGTVFTLLTLPTQESLKVNVTAWLSTDASINGTSGNFTTINDTVCKVNISLNSSVEDDNIVKASDQEFFDMNVTLQDKYGNKAEESRLINYSTTFGIHSKINGTTINGIDTLKIRSLYPGNATVIANSSGLLNGSIEVWFYGPATKINVTANNSTAGTAAVATIRALDVNNLTDESFTDRINVTVSGHARIYNGTNTTIVWNNTAWNETALTLDYKGNGTVLVNDSTAETISIGVWSSGLSSENTTITFSPNITVSWLNASAPINNTTIENSLQVIIEANGASGNLIDCSLPVTVSLNNTIARITSTTLSNSYIYPNETMANGTLVNGTANVTITGTTTAGCVNVTPDSAELDSAYETNATIKFFAGPYTQVNITTNRRYMPANGTDNATLTATLRDEYGNANLTDNVTIDLKTTFASETLTQTDNTTDNGAVSANLSSTTEGTATIYANTSDPQITKINNATVTFVGNATNFTLAVSKTEAQIGENVTITVQVVDTDGNPVSEQKEFNLTNSSNSGNAQLYYMNGSGYTNGTNVSTFLFNGTYTFTLSDETPEIVTLSLNTSSGLTPPSDDIGVTFKEFTNIITLREDWNLVSVPKTLAEANDSPGAVFTLTAGEITWHYNAGNETWVYPDKIEPCKGYWVYKEEQKEVRLSYKNMTGPEMPPSVNLYVGWDMIGHTSVESMLVNQSLVTIVGKYDIIFKYNGTWHSYIAGVSSAQDFANLTPAQGYWIRMKEDAILYAVDM